MHDPQIRATSLYAGIFGLLTLGLLVGAWWLPYLGWLAVLCGQVVLYMCSEGQHHRTHALCRAALNARPEPSNGGARPIR